MAKKNVLDVSEDAALTAAATLMASFQSEWGGFSPVDYANLTMELAGHFLGKAIPSDSILKKELHKIGQSG